MSDNTSPSAANTDEATTLRAALDARRIAIVGLSANPARPSYDVASYLVRATGYELVGVNPGVRDAVLGIPMYPTLAAVPGRIDMVDVFRAADALPEVVEDTIAVDAPFLWTQFGVVHAAALERARSAGLRCVVDRCLKIEHARHGGPR
ncbi:MAG: CoA-binding protein [Pseudomonadota bacterium]